MRGRRALATQSDAGAVAGPRPARSRRSRAGEFVCIVGPSGCGKSTLLELLAGLRTPDDRHRSRSAGARSSARRASRGVVFQQSSSLYPWLTVAGNVELGLKLQRICGEPSAGARVDAELRRVGLAEFADHRVYELSGGMQQRCQIARALAADPEVLLARRAVRRTRRAHPRDAAGRAPPDLAGRRDARSSSSPTASRRPRCSPAECS